jgi:hypothetical protein
MATLESASPEVNLIRATISEVVKSLVVQGIGRSPMSQAQGSVSERTRWSAQGSTASGPITNGCLVRFCYIANGPRAI